MLFSSMVFIWIFLPVVLILNYAAQWIGGNRLANILLLIASVLFYAWGEPVYVLLMLFSIFINWAGGMVLCRVGKGKKIVLAATVALNLLLLAYFKYAGMIVVSVNNVFGTSFSNPEVSLPIGISFFTFQALSYVIDVYRGECEVQKNILKLALYVSFFPQLIAGPIVKYKDIAEQIDNRNYDNYIYVYNGIRRFSYGLGKKVLISNVLAATVDKIYSLEANNINWSLAWIAALMYTFQIYYDFSGYSDMAIGLGKMFGFEFRENFNYPYISQSIREFWRRWHISLSSWFRDYVYIPLGGSRHGKWSTYRNLIIVFLLTGLWHGASWNFVLWGLFHGFFIVIERLGFSKILDKNKAFAWLYTVALVNWGWVLFRIENIGQALTYIEKMMLPWKYWNSSVALFQIINGHNLFILAVAILGAGILQRIVPKKIKTYWKDSYLEIIFCMILMILSIAALAGNMYNPFIYFRF